jgi:hypothetical protein
LIKEKRMKKIVDEEYNKLCALRKAECEEFLRKEREMKRTRVKTTVNDDIRSRKKALKRAQRVAFFKAACDEYVRVLERYETLSEEVGTAPNGIEFDIAVKMAVEQHKILRRAERVVRRSSAYLQ